jgi:hypothetical protein
VKEACCGALGVDEWGGRCMEGSRCPFLCSLILFLGAKSAQLTLAWGAPKSFAEVQYPTESCVQLIEGVVCGHRQVGAAFGQEHLVLSHHGPLQRAVVVDASSGLGGCVGRGNLCVKTAV